MKLYGPSLHFALVPLGPVTRASAPGSDFAELFYLVRRGNFLQLA
jgi:hypothetical protein